MYFNPRPPWGGRPGSASNHTYDRVFQSTPSVGRATNSRLKSRYIGIISIHALRGEGDSHIIDSKIINFKYFNPRPPWGGRRSGWMKKYYPEYYISIHALRGEGDVSLYPKFKKGCISIHALRGEGDE